MTFTREQWSVSVLNSIGNNAPTQDIVNWVVNWTKAESVAFGSAADYNLLNTTQTAPGSSPINGIGIQKFADYNSSVSATAATLKNGYYPDLLAALQSNNGSSLGFTGNLSPAIAVNLNKWCGACGYGNAFAQGGSSSNSEVFQGAYTGGNGKTSNAAAQKMVAWIKAMFAGSVQKWGQGCGPYGCEQGFDYGVTMNTPIPTIYGGKVVFAGKTDWGGSSSSGGVVVVETTINNVKQYFYQLHLNSANVKQGDTVNPGDIIGMSGGQTSGGNWNTDSQFTSGPHGEVGFNANFLSTGNVGAALKAQNIKMPANFDPYPLLTDVNAIAASGGGGGTGNDPGSGGNNNGGNKTGGSNCAPWDFACMTNEALNSTMSSDFFQRGTIIFIALVIILLGILILFFSNGGVQKSAEVAAMA